MIDFAVLSVLATLVLGVRLIRDLRPRAVAAGVERWSERFGLTVTEDVRPFLVRRRRATWLGYAVGLWLGMELGAVTQLLTAGQHWSLVGDLATQAGWWIGGGIGAVLGGSLGARLVPPVGPRVARPRAVTVADYVDPVERALVPIAAAVALCVGLVPLLDGATGATAVNAAAAGIGSCAFAGCAAVLARAAVVRPQRADSPHLLAWSDALRSETVRGALGASALIAAGTLVLSLPAAVTASGSGAREGAVMMWTLVGLVALLAASWIRSMRTRPARYFLRRLWPTTFAELTEHERPMEEVSR